MMLSSLNYIEKMR